jgi:hypothetical protein
MKLMDSISAERKNLSIIEMLPILFFAGRLLFFIALMPTDIRGMGDFPNYFSVANLPGLPYFDYWTEYPPFFAFTISFINQISQGNQFIFDFILYFIITISGAVSIWLFSKIASQIRKNHEDIIFISVVYFGFLSFISYSWWYFDLVVVTIMLMSIHFLLNRKEKTVGLWLGIGILAKWFPILLIPAIFLFENKKRFLKTLLLATGMVVLVWLFLFIFSPEMTLTSLKSQPSRNSWETAWALLDGNLMTGAFIPVENRLDPSLFNQNIGNPATIPVWLTFIFFAGIGIFLMLKIKQLDVMTLIPFIGITWILFFLWSPGWSPQWILYIIPIILLTFSPNKGFLVILFLALISLLEWPLLLGRQVYAGLWILILLRIIIFIALFIFWSKRLFQKRNDYPINESP